MDLQIVSDIMKAHCHSLSQIANLELYYTPEVRNKSKECKTQNRYLEHNLLKMLFNV